METIVVTVAIFFFVVFALFVVVLLTPVTKTGTQQNEQHFEDNPSKPKLKPLTEEQIADIHSRGKITPAEQLKEWEDMELCAPGDAIGSAAWRCRKFGNCHDCLIDLTNSKDEWTSFLSVVKDVNNQYRL